MLKPAVLIIFIRFALSHIARMLPVRYQSNVASSSSLERTYRQLYPQIITTITAALLLRTAPQTVLQTQRLFRLIVVSKLENLQLEIEFSY